MLLDLRGISEAGADLEDDGCTARTWVEDVGGELQSLAVATNLTVEPHEEPPLDIEGCLEYPGALRHTSEPEPLNGSDGQLRPSVIEVAGLRCRVEHVLVVDRERHFLPGHRSFTSRSDAVRPAEDAANHRCDRELPGFAPGEVVSDPERAGAEVLVVVARFEVQPFVVGGEGRGSVAILARNNVAVDG